MKEINLPLEVLESWQLVLTELAKTKPPYLGQEQSFGYENEFESKLSDFFEKLIESGFNELEKPEIKALMLDLGINQSLANECSERWLVSQGRSYLYRSNLVQQQAKICKRIGDELEAEIQFKIALELLETAEKFKPCLEDALSKAWCYRELGQFEKALEIYDREIASDSSNFIVYRLRAKIHQELGNKLQAGRDRKMATKLEKAMIRDELNK